MKSALWDVYCNFCASRQLIFKKAGYELSSMTKVNSTKEKSPASYCRFTIAELGDSSGRLLMSFVSGSKASIFVRKIAGPTERSRRGGLPPLRKLAGKDLRFSMKMMRAACLDPKRQPAWTVSVPDTLFLHP